MVVLTRKCGSCSVHAGDSHRDFSFLFFHSIFFFFYSIYNLNIIKAIFRSNAEVKLVKMRYTADFLVSGLPQECETICFDAFTHEWDDLQ